MPSLSPSKLAPGAPLKKGMFERRHYTAIAEMVASLPDGPLTRDIVAQHFATALGSSNERFNLGRFVDACSPNSETK